MKKASFTLIEILVVLAILSILATLGFSQYQNFIEEAKAKVCAVNLDVLQSALDIYIMEHDAIPANLSLKDDLAKGNIQLISCPKDNTSPLKGGTRSYALNSDLKNLTVAQYKALSDETVTIGDCEGAELSSGLLNLAENHRLQGQDRGMTITKKHKVCESKNDGSCKRIRHSQGSSSYSEN